MSNRRRLLVQSGRRRQTADESAESSTGRRRQTGGSPPPEREELPPYEPPLLPLDDKRLRAVAELANNRTLTRQYDAHLKKSAELLREAVGSVNDLYSERKSDLQRLSDRRRERGAEQPSKNEALMVASVDKLSADVPALTRDLERQARLVIDRQIELLDDHEALQWTNDQIVLRQTEERQRQRQREQRRAERQERKEVARARRAAASDVKMEGGGMDDEEGEEEEQEDQDEDEGEDGEGEQEASKLVELLQQARERRRDEYARMDAYRRYGLNNDYIEFKSVWHDALYPDGDVNLPDASNWFGEEGEPRMYGPVGAFGDGGGAEANDGEDEDLIVAREVISLKCPLTLRTMVDPYKSRLCNHTFEKQGIMEFLQGGPTKCPQTGCDKTISKQDLIPDDVMRRRIERAEQQAQRVDAGATSDVEAEEVEDGEEDGAGAADNSVMAGRAQALKRERFR